MSAALVWTFPLTLLPTLRLQPLSSSPPQCSVSRGRTPARRSPSPRSPMITGRTLTGSGPLSVDPVNVYATVGAARADHASVEVPPALGNSAENIEVITRSRSRSRTHARDHEVRAGRLSDGARMCRPRSPRWWPRPCRGGSRSRQRRSSARPSPCPKIPLVFAPHFPFGGTLISACPGTIWFWNRARGRRLGRGADP